jgi:hypothetical protein
MCAGALTQGRNSPAVYAAAQTTPDIPLTLHIFNKPFIRCELSSHITTLNNPNPPSLWLRLFSTHPLFFFSNLTPLKEKESQSLQWCNTSSPPGATAASCSPFAPNSTRSITRLKLTPTPTPPTTTPHLPLFPPTLVPTEQKRHGNGNGNGNGKQSGNGNGMARRMTMGRRMRKTRSTSRNPSLSPVCPCGCSGAAVLIWWSRLRC